MTTAFLIALGAIAIFVALLALVSAGRETGPSRRAKQFVSCQDLVRRIFSCEDYDFISRLGSRRLSQFFDRERQEVALHWVRQISQEASYIMRAHRLASRQAEQLRPSLEARLILYYLDLRLACGGLALLIWAFGPHRLGTLAAHVGERFRLIDEALANATRTLRVTSPR